MSECRPVPSRLVTNSRRSLAVLFALVAVAVVGSSSLAIHTPRATALQGVNPLELQSSYGTMKDLVSGDAAPEVAGAPAAVATSVFTAAFWGQSAWAAFLAEPVIVVGAAAISFDVGLAIGTYANRHYIHSWARFT